MTAPSIPELQALVGQEMSGSPSPMGRWLRGILRSIDEGAMSVEFTVRPEMTNPAGVLHGGMIAAMLDDSIGVMVHSLVGIENYHTTVNLSIDYLAPAMGGDVVTASTKIIRHGKTMINAEGWLYNAAGKPLARATTNMLRVLRG